MPPKTEKGRREAAEVAGFIHQLYEFSGFTSWGQFAREIGVSAEAVSDWKRAENSPNGYNLLRAMRAARWCEELPEVRPIRDGDAEARELALVMNRVVDALSQQGGQLERILGLLERLTSAQGEGGASKSRRGS